MSAQIEISDFITIIRPQFMTFCKDACRAATLNHMLFRIAWKCKDQPKEKIQSGDVLWYAKNEQITSEMSNAWGVCKVRQEVNALIDMNLIGKKKNPAWGADRTKHFCFGSEQCAVFLKHCEDNNICVVHLDLPVEVRHLIYSSVANDKSIKCSCEKGEANDKSIDCKSYNHQMEMIEVSDGNDESIKAIPKNTTKTTTEEHDKEESTYPQPESHSDDSGSVEPTRTHSLSDTSQVKGHDDGRSDDNDHLLSGHARRDAAAVRGAVPVRVSSQQQADEREVHPAEPVATRAGRSARTESGSTQAGMVTENNTHSQLSTSTGTYPQQSAKVSRSSRQKAKLAEPKLPPTAEPTAPVMPPADAEWKTTTCLLMFTVWRGKPLIGTYKNSQASTCAKGLATNYTRAQVEQVRAYMVEDDPYWSQRPERVDVCQVADHIHEKLAEMARKQKPTSKTKVARKSIPTREEDPYSIAALIAEQNPGYFA